MVFEHLTEDEVERLCEDFLSHGMSEDDAFNEIYSMDCRMDFNEDSCFSKPMRDA